jgi:hypothetical protein
MNPPSACTRSPWPAAVPVPLLVRSCPGTVARRAGGTETVLVGHAHPPRAAAATCPPRTPVRG